MDMSHEKKLSFIHKMAKLGLDSIPHYDGGGTVVGGPTTNAGTPNTNQAGTNNYTEPVTNTINNSTPLSLIPGVSNSINGLGGAFTNNFQGTAAPIQQGTNVGQLNAAYTGAQGALGNQGNLVNQTQPGVVQGLGAQSALSGQLSNEAAGQGPNPAQMALNQSTGQNIAQQAALAAGQRGASTNAGLIASQNAQQGAATQQQAVGQAATLQAQQQIAAQQAQQQLAAQQVGQGAGAIQGANAAQQNEQGILQGANTAGNNANVSQQNNLNNINAQTAAGNQAMVGNIFGGLTSGAASAIASAFAKGGEVHKMASGGTVTPLVVNNPYPTNGPQSAVGQYLNNSSQIAGAAPSANSVNIGAETLKPMGSGQSSMPTASPTAAETPITNSGYTQPDLGSSATPQPQSYGLGVDTSYAGGGNVRKMLPPMHGKNASLKAGGGKVKADGKGQEAKVNHDSYANDKVHAMLTEGEVVMDKDTLNDPGQIGQMARAVAHHIAQRNSARGNNRVKKS